MILERRHAYERGGCSITKLFCLRKYFTNSALLLSRRRLAKIVRRERAHFALGERFSFRTDLGTARSVMQSSTKVELCELDYSRYETKQLFIEWG